MLTSLRILLGALGVSAVAIAASILVRGAEATAAAGEALYAALTGYAGPPSGPWPPSMDSELRFYAALWGAYGIALLLASSRPEVWRRSIPYLALTFFLGGVGRAVSHLELGAPHPFFTLLMAIELALPPAMLALWMGARRQLGYLLT
jgi:hypothetical protein